MFLAQIPLLTIAEAANHQIGLRASLSLCPTTRCYARTNSIVTLRPNARAALPSVFSVIEELDASNKRRIVSRLGWWMPAVLSVRPN